MTPDKTPSKNPQFMTRKELSESHMRSADNMAAKLSAAYLAKYGKKVQK